MSGSLQRAWLKDILESTPSLLFVVLLRSDVDLDIAGWMGAALAALVLVGFRLHRVRFSPILLGINIHLLIITPLIVVLFEMGASEPGAWLQAVSYKAVLVTIFLVGCALTLLSRDGFIGVAKLSPSNTMTYSAILLAASFTTIVWSFAFATGTVLGVAVPVLALFGLRRLLIARSLDSSTPASSIAASGGAALMYESTFDTD